MTTRTYRLATTATATGSTSGTVTAVTNGRIVGILMRQCGTGGAGTGRIHAEVVLNGQGTNSFAFSNNPPRETVLTGMAGCTPTTTSVVQNGSFVPLSVPYRAGNTFTINLTIGGTAPATLETVADVFVVEN